MHRQGHPSQIRYSPPTTFKTMKRLDQRAQAQRAKRLRSRASRGSDAVESLHAFIIAALRQQP